VTHPKDTNPFLRGRDGAQRLYKLMLDIVLLLCYNGTMSTEKPTNINTSYPSDVYTAIKQFAQEDERSFHNMVIWILRDYIKRRLGTT